MYSLILMTAVAAGPDAQAFGGRFASCHGCCGGYVASCHGCCGGYVTSCHGCCGGLSSYSSCHGCCGGFVTSCHGCMGGCFGGGCYGSCYGMPGGCFGGCQGVITGPVVGGPVGSGYTPYVPPSATPPATPPASNSPAEPGDKSTAESGVTPVAAAGPAQLTLQLPAGAKLFVDGRPTRGEGASRQFHTPVLPAGQAFFYEFRAELAVGDDVEVETRKVVVRAGDVLTESFPKLLAAAAPAPAIPVAPPVDVLAAK